MFARERTKEILVMVVAALFLMAFVYTAFAAESTPLSYAGSYAGKVVALDNAKKVVTVRSAAGDEKMFTLNDYAQVLKCGKAEALDTINVGDEVTISYFEKTAGNYVADSITLSPGMMKHCS